jgi:hypothetical protein
VIWLQNHLDGLSVGWTQTTGTVWQLFGLKIIGTIFSNLFSVGFLVQPQNQGGGEFFGSGLKTDGYGLVIWSSKLSRWFLNLGLKIKQASVCWCTWKEVWLGFSSLSSRLTEAWRQVVRVALSRRLRWSHVEDRRIDVTGCVRPCYLCFTVFVLLVTMCIVVI